MELLVAQIIIGIVVLSVMVYLSHALLPDFKRSQMYSSMANRLLKSEAEHQRAKQGKMESFIAYSLIPKIQKRINIELLFGRNIRTMHDLLNTKSTFEVMLAAKLVKAILYSIPTLVLPLVTGEMLFSLAYPASVIFTFFYEVKGIRNRFQGMQRTITKDLPLLIDKMMIALEAGKPFITVFQELEKNTTGRMNFLLKRLNGNILNMKPEEAIQLFAKETTIPVMMQFASAVKIGINNGYEEAKAYFDDIKEEILDLRKIALEQITSSKPKRVAVLNALLIFCSLVAVFLSMYEVLKKVNSI
ncbi:hypothetical protein [Paenibacillus agricola]|uniref:Tight adherence protein C n=1 Tax=Paenibacillus agricola TaxID=2716264 RepID=A0ABX0JIR1_9BACL|nr:hypothetical protein [Paenibacillus agricola]NHN34887.1 hypothetical protein [Paenibacillus agricola]